MHLNKCMYSLISIKGKSFHAYMSIALNIALCISIYMSRIVRKQEFCLCETNTQLSFAVTAKSAPLFSLHG